MKNKVFVRIITVLLTVAVLFAVIPAVVAAGTEVTVEFGTVQGKAGQEISVPVTIKNNPGIATFRFRVYYDNEALELLSVAKGSILTAGSIESSVNTEDGFVTFLWFTTAGDITADGEIALLNFKVSENAENSYSLKVKGDPEGLVSSSHNIFDYTVEDGLIFIGSNITGNITSFGAADGAVTLRLLSGGNEIAKAVSTNGKYTLKSIPAGKYVLEVSKLNHATRKYEITLGDSDLTMDVKIHLIGDITGDGKVNITDVNKANAHASKTKLLTDYDFACADVNSDGKVNITDVNKINAHANKTKYLW